MKLKVGPLELVFVPGAGRHSVAASIDRRPGPSGTETWLNVTILDEEDNVIAHGQELLPPLKAPTDWAD